MAIHDESDEMINRRNSENSSTFNGSLEQMDKAIDPSKSSFPFCIVWTPIPCLTWFLPWIGHMGICTSSGVIRDFAGPYFVSEGNMAFGNPTKYWQLDPIHARNGKSGWDVAISEASEVYKGRMHNLFCDNCHSHVALALNLMQYQSKTSWNMVVLAFLMLLHGKYVSFGAAIKTWLPFIILMGCIIVILVALQFRDVQSENLT